MENEKKPWFKPKSFGWGWQPNTWEGWVLTALYTIGLIRAAVRASVFRSMQDFLINFGLDFLILTTLFLVICYITSKFPLRSASNAPMQPTTPSSNSVDNPPSQTQH